MGNIGVGNCIEGCLMYRGCTLCREGLFKRWGVLGGLFRGGVGHIGEECGV